MMKPLHIRLLVLVVLIFPFIPIFSQDAIIPFVKIKDHKGNTTKINVDCDYDFLTNKGIKLTATYPDLRQTNSYLVSSIDYTPVASFNQGDVIDIRNNVGKLDDTYSNVINLPFNFCFYGNSYSQIIISDNGVISFNIALAQQECPYAPPNPTPTGLPKNSIFGVFHDMQNINQVRYLVDGVAPNRRFIINYNNIPQYGYPMPGKNSTSQIVLYETTNIIDVYVKDRFKNESTNPIFDGNGAYRKNAIIGLTNYDSSAGIAPPGRNTGNWEAHNEAWRFNPSGTSNITIQWLNQFDSEISGTRNSESIVVYPTQSTKYKVKVTFNMCVPITVEDVIDIEFSQDFPTATEITTKGFCINNNGTHTLDLTPYEAQTNPDPTLSFSYFENQNLTTPILSKEAYEFSNNKTLYVKVLKSGVCYSVGKLNLKINKRPVITLDQSFEKCDTDNDGKETLNLNALGITGLSGSSYKFYESLAAANAGTPEITNYSNYLLDVTADPNNTQTLYLRAWNASYNDPDCYTIVPFKIKLKNYIEVKKPTTPFLICHVTEGQLIKNYNLTQYEPLLLDNPNTGVNFEYFTTSNYSSSYKITNPSLASFTMNTTIYIKATKAGYCDAYTQIKLAADDDCDGNPGGGGGGGGGATGPGGPGGGGGPICGTDETSITVNLADDYLKFFLQGGLNLSDITILGFYNSANNSLLTNTAPYEYAILPPSFLVIQARYKINATGVESYVNFPVSASKKALISPDTFDICDTYNDNQEIITVKSTNNPKPKWQIHLETAYPQATIYFFSSNNDLNNYIAAPDDPENNSKIITKATITPPSKTVYVYVKYYGCIYTHEIKFNLIPVVVKQTSPYIICDFDDDKKEFINISKITNNETDLKNQITAQQLIGLQTPIRYYKTLTQAHAGATDFITNLTNFEINTSQMSVFARLNIQDECAVIVELKFQFTTSVALPVIKNLIICDTNNDNQEKVNLSNAIVSTNPNAQVTFYITSDAAEAGDETSPYFIATEMANDYLVTVSPTTIYIRVYDQITTCWKILDFTITLIQTPVLSNKMIKTCDAKNDGKEILTSAYIQAQLISNNASIRPAMTYKFYKTQADAVTNTISSLTSFEATETNSVWVNIAQTQGDCPIIEELKFTLVKSPILETRALVYTICNNNTGNENAAINENIILDTYKNDILGFSSSPTYTFTYYDTTENDAIAGGSFGKVSSAYTVTSFPKTIWARVTNTSTGCFSTKSIVFEQTPSLETAISDFEIITCANGEMSKEVNLEDYPSQMIIAPASLSDFNISYHNSRTNAVKNINLSTDITHYTATPASQIWLKFVNKTTGCYIIKKLSVTIYSTPKAQDIFPEVCDETDGKLDGNYIIPNLDIYKNQIITGESNLELLYTFSYYNNMADANAKNANTISPTNYTFNETNLESGPYPDPDCYTHTIFARIDKQDNTGCFSVVAISFQINKKVAVHAEQPEILNCDESDNDGKSNFDLTTVQDQISTTLGVSFKYYPTKDDAQNNTNEITNVNNWQNQTPYEHMVYVRTAASGYCDNIGSVKLKVYPYIQAVDYANEGYCEFESDGLTKRTVNLLTEVENMTAQINSITQYPNLSDNLNIHFYKTLADAQQHHLVNSISTESLTNYLFPVDLTHLWVRFQSKTTDCFEIKKLSITIFDTPNTQDIAPVVCDETDGKLDGNFVIPDLHAYKNQIITNEPNLDNLYTFTYYKNQADAFAKNSNTIDNLNYTFTEADLLIGTDPAPDSHTIYTRVDKQDNTGCFSVAALSFQIKKKVPVNSEQPEILNCDESDNDGKTNFDLTTVQDQISTILGVSFKYYPTKDDAQNSINEIIDLNNWQNQTPYEHIVYVRTTTSGYCDNIASIKLKVYPYIQATDYTTEYCEFESDGLTPTTANLLAEVENMTAQINSITEYPNLSDDIDIHFYNSLGDAQNPTLINSISTVDLTDYSFPVGTTTIWVRFQNKTTNCFEIKKMTLKKLKAPEVNTEVIPFRCSPENDLLDAVVKITPLDNNKIYTYSFDNGLTFSSTGTFNTNQSETIHYVVSDPNGCKISSNIFVPGYTPPIDMDIQTAIIYCNTPNNHPIITVNNVSVPETGTTYTYEIIEPAGIAPANATGIFSGLTAQTYQVKATDDVTKCYIIKPVEVIKAPEISVVVQSHTDVLCHGESTGAITYAVSNFITSSRYSYELIPNLLGLTSNQSNDIITYEGLTAGNYTFKVTDNLSGCTSEVADFTISQPIAPLTFSGTAKNITCNSSNDGKIVIRANGGTGSVKYAISPNLTDFNDNFEFTNLAPGTYQIAVQDQAGCSGNGLLTLEITEPAILTAQVIGPILQEMCDGDEDGSFNIAISGGTPPYSVSLDDVNGTYNSVSDSQYDFTNLSGGTHKVFIKDTYCSTELEVIMDKAVTLNPEVKIDYDCLNNIAINSVTVKIHPDNTNADDIDYALDDTNFQHSNVFENVSSGTHTITARHSNGCQQTTLPFTIDEIKKLSITLSEGGLNEIIASADGGYGEYQYSINGEDHSFNNKIIIYKSGIYTFEATDKKGCTVTTSKYFEYVDLCIPNHFTPNGDGINDTWAPGCTTNYTNLTYDIIDRYGRIICKYRLGQEWDGKYNGTELPSGDYWYLIKLNDPNDDREFIGHFTLYR